MTKEKNNSFFKNALDLFRRNWGLKLLALVLAILIYQTMKPSHDSTRFNHDRNILQNR